MKLLVTIDTEADCDTKWRRSKPLTFTSITEGIPKFFRPLWDALDVHPIYFVSPEVLDDEQSVAILRDERAKGAILGAHLHPEHIEPEKVADMAGRPASDFPCSSHTYEIEKEKILNLTRRMEEVFGEKPLWYRAGRFGADGDTIRILAEQRYRYDSSVTPCIDWSHAGGPDHSHAPDQPYFVSPENIAAAAPGAKVEEFPVTIRGKRGGLFGRFLPERWLYYRWLRPTMMSIFEERNLIDDFARTYTAPTLVMMFHSMEVMPGKSPFVRSRFMQRMFLTRLEKTLRYAKEKYHAEL